MTTTAPSFFASFWTIFRLQWTRLIRGRKWRLGFVAVLLVVIAIGAIRYLAADVEPVRVLRDGVRLGWFRFLVFLLPFLFTSGVISEEIENRTLPYLTIRPVSRFALAFGKYLAGTAMAAALTLAGIFILHLIVFATKPDLLVDELLPTARAAGAALLLVIGNSAICLLWGALAVEAAGIVSTIYLALIEFGLSFVPVLQYASMNYYGVQLAGYEPPSFIEQLQHGVDDWIGLVVIGAITLIMLALGGLIVQVSEYRFGKA